MELNQNPWKKWGFANNPFSTKALTANSHLPINKAFVGRPVGTEESRQLLNFIRNPGGGSCLVEGLIGVGKTTLVNYHKYLWEYEAEEKLLTPLREISVYGRWEAKDLLIEILGHLSNKLLYLFEQEKSNKQGGKLDKRKQSCNNDFLKKIRFLHEIFYHESAEVEGSLFGFGFGYSKNTSVNIPNITESQLVAYLMDMVGEIKKIGYNGVILHFDNLELLSKQDLEKCQRLFEEIRDIMQLPDIYYIFIAQRGFYSQVIAPSDRVRSIMSWPIQVPPLTCEEVIEAIKVRCQILSLEPGKEIVPLTNSFIRKLYDLYGGKIRFVMDSVAKIVINFPENSPRTLHDKEAETLLLNITRLKTNRLTAKENEVLRTMIKLEEFSNEEVASLMKMQRSNVSKIIKHFLEYNLIYLARRQGKKLYYRIIEDLKILVVSLKSHTQKERARASKQAVMTKENRYQKLFTYLNQHPTITRPIYQEMVGISMATANRDLASLRKQGKLEKQGRGKSTIYRRVSE